jgi:hypothetical protein
MLVTETILDWNEAEVNLASGIVAGIFICRDERCTAYKISFHALLLKASRE